MILFQRLVSFGVACIVLSLIFNELANVEDGSCNPFSDDVFGCMDEIAFNFDSLANIDNGGCIDVILGRTDSNYIEYNAQANTDDESCLTIIVYGCKDETAFNYNELANTDDGSCEAVLEGCTDSTAFNYDLDANTDDGSCDYPIDLGASVCGVTLSTQLDKISGNYGYEEFENPQRLLYITSLDSSSVIEISYDMEVLECYHSCYAEAQVLLFENNSLVNIWMHFEDFYQGTFTNIPYELALNSGDYTLVYGNINYNYYPSIGMSLNDAISQIYYTHSFNENENFTFQIELLTYDGTCDYPGCTDSNALNFNQDANTDNGSCEYPTNLGNSNVE